MNRDRMPIVLVEDRGWEALRPLTWLRPACELFVGGLTSLERWKKATGSPATVLCRPLLARMSPGQRAGRSPAGEAWRLWARDRLIPDADWAREAVDRRQAAAWSHEGTVVAVRTDRAAPRDIDPSGETFWEALAEGLSPGPLEGARLLVELPDLVREGTERIEADLAAALPGKGAATRFGDAEVYSPERIAAGQGCRIDHGAVLDARDGPIVLGASTQVLPHTWIRGPFGCREHCLLLGGRIGGGTYLGPHCRVRGEVEASTFHGFVNKAHDGFIGHSYLGEWVNLGALTTTSDLKNNYGSVRLEAYGRRIDSGQQKIGSFMGDHAKTRIGTMLNTGSVIGMAANLFGEVALFPKWIPDFVWGVGKGAEEYGWDRCLRTVETVLSRRGQTCTGELREALRAAFEESQAGRDAFLRSEGVPRRREETSR